MDPFWFIICCAVLVWQLTFCFLFKRVWLRLIPTLVAVLSTLVFFVFALFAEGWDVIGYLAWSFVCALMLGVCMMAWIVFAIVRIIQKRRARRVPNTVEE